MFFFVVALFEKRALSCFLFKNDKIKKNFLDAKKIELKCFKLILKQKQSTTFSTKKLNETHTRKKNKERNK
jgi:hypothetical protein